jgi:hypothetical protein
LDVTVTFQLPSGTAWLPAKRCEAFLIQAKYYSISHFGSVVVSVLAIGPKVLGFKPSQGDGFLRVIKIRSTPVEEK